LFVLPDHDPGVDVADDELELLRCLSPVDRAEDAAHLGRREQALQHSVTVLPEPEDAVAPAEALGEQGVGQAVHPVVHLGERGAIAPADEGIALWVAPPVLAQDVAESQRVQEIHGRESDTHVRERQNGDMPILDSDTHLYERRTLWADY